MASNGVKIHLILLCTFLVFSFVTFLDGSFSHKIGHFIALMGTATCVMLQDMKHMIIGFLLIIFGSIYAIIVTTDGHVYRGGRLA